MAVVRVPGVTRLFGSSIVARLPLAMFRIALLVHARHLTGSFAAAGIVTGSYAGAVGAGAPLLGRLVDRRGQTVVLLGSATASTLLLTMVALLPHGSPLAVLVALAIAIGFATPPLGACVRTTPTADARRSAHTSSCVRIRVVGARADFHFQDRHSRCGSAPFGRHGRR